MPGFSEHLACLMQNLVPPDTVARPPTTQLCFHIYCFQQHMPSLSHSHQCFHTRMWKAKGNLHKHTHVT